jgi:hypothetical protein
MSTIAEVLYHPINKTQEQAWAGFSWPAFFFGPIWLLIKGLWGHAIIYILAALVTVGWGAPLLWFVYGFMGNGLHRSDLLKKGYLTSAQAAVPKEATTAAPSMSPGDPIQRLKDLADLRDRGALTDAEFQTQKAKIVA